MDDVIPSIGRSEASWGVLGRWASFAELGLLHLVALLDDLLELTQVLRVPGTASGGKCQVGGRVVHVIPAA